MNYRLASAALLSAAALAACAHSGSANLPPQSSNLSPLSVTTSGGVTTISGQVVAVKSSSEFQVQGGTGCGSVNIYTTSSTTFSPSGARPAVGDYSVSSGSGSCATSLTATSVQLTASSPSPAPSSTPLPASETIGSGEIFGHDNVFTPNDGDTSSGGQGNTTSDGIPCASTMPNTYHVHAFVGILINGRQLALPDGVGMKNPGADGTYAGIPNWTEYASCYYYIHTHDASGVLHIESPKSVSLSSSIYTLSAAFNVWGMALSSTQIGPYTGTVRAYVAKVPLKTGQILRSYYTLYSGNPRSIPLYSHTTIWLEIGPTYIAPSSLPVLNYYEEY